jgi:prolyl oligopeptidase
VTLALLGASLLTTGWAAPQAKEAALKPPPATRADDVKETLHGVEVVDPYRWLEDQNAPETRAWIDAQNAYTRSMLDPRPGRDLLRERATALLKIDSVGSPTERNGRYFFSKRRADQDQAVLYLRKGFRGTDEALIDPNTMSADHSVTVGMLDVSEDGTVMAYSVRQGGADEFTPRLFDVDARKDLPDQLPKSRYYGFSLMPDKSGIYYTLGTPQGPRVYWHKMGADVATDTEVFGKGYGPEIIIGSDISENGRYLLLHIVHGSAADQTEIFVQDIAAKGPITAIIDGVPARFIGGFAGDTLIVQTNWKAPKGRMLAVDIKNPSQDHWREIVPESDVVIEGNSLVGGKLGVYYTKNASSVVKLFDLDGKLVRDVPLPAIGSVGGFSGRWTSNEAFYVFTSFHIPTTIYRYDLAAGTQEIWSKLSVPIDTSKFEVKQVWYSSKDGTKVPMFLVYAKGLKLDGTNPTLLTGYGGFNSSETPVYSSTAALWITGGGVYAVANLRGGGEFGEDWHKAGMLEIKQNVFDDFFAASEWLIKNKYTRPSRLAIMGGSNGGLLVGAAVTQRPELYGAVVCLFPLLDMLRYQNFLVARFWVPEYGSAEKADQFKYLYAYSPYHQVKPGSKYPGVLFVTGDSDTRVAPLHARKMAARMQAANGSGKPVLLLYDTKAGHSGGTPVSKQIDNLVDYFSFIYWQLGVTQNAPGTK